MKQPFLTKGICSAFSRSIYRSSIEVLHHVSSAQIYWFQSCPQTLSLSAWNFFSRRSIVSELLCPIDSKLLCPFYSKLPRPYDTKLLLPIHSKLLRPFDSKRPRPIDSELL